MTWFVGVLALALLGYGIRVFRSRSATSARREAEKREATKRQRRQDFETVLELRAALKRPLGASDEPPAPPPSG
jgi:hypothetical protein